MINLFEKNSRNVLLIKQLNTLIGSNPNLTIRFHETQYPIPGRIVSILNKWLEILQKVFVRISTDSIMLSSLAPNITKIANMVHNTTEKQMQKAEDILTESENLNQAVENIVFSTKDAVNHSRNMLNLTAEAQDYGQASTQQTETVKQMMDETIKIINHLEAQSYKINNVMTAINDIASKTHVISLNASIQAAIAGEAGLGFSVIAQEVRNLSGNIIEATEEIQSEISDLLNQIQRAVGYVAKVETAVNESHHVISQADTSLKKVTHHHSILHQSLNTIADSTELQKLAMVSIIEKIKGISALSDDQSKEEDNLLQVVNSLNTHCDGLLIQVGSFRLQQHENAKQLAVSISSHPDIVQGNRATKEAKLKQIARQNDWIELLYITDASGRQVVSNISTKEVKTAYHSDGYGEDWKSRPWFAEVKKTRTVFISDVYRSKATDDFCFTVSTPVINSQNQFSGVLAIDVNFSHMISG